MSKRTNTAQWEEKYQRWRIAVQKDGVRKQFYSSTPGRTGQREANAKADRWLDDGIGVKARRVDDLYQEWYATVVKTTGTGNQRNVESRWRTRILPAIGRKRITSLTEQDLQDVVNDAYSDGLAKKSLQSLCADMRAFCKWCRAKKLTTFHPEGLHVPAGARPKGKKVLQPDALITLFRVDTTLYRGKRVHDDFIHAYRFQVLTGLRPGELVGLRWADVKGGTVFISRAVNVLGEQTRGKNDNAVRAFVLSDLARAVLEQQRAVTGASESVFCLKSEAYYYKRWQVYCRVNEIPPVSAYEMRHTFVSVAKKLPAGEVKDLVGHSEDMDTFGVYGHALTGEDTETAQAVNGMFPWNEVLPYIIAQLLGAVAGQLIVYVTYLPHYKDTDDAEAILGTFCTTDAHNDRVNYFLNEFFGTFMLVLGALCCLSLPWGKANPAAASIVVGFIVWGLVTSMGGPTGPGLNPARDLMPRLLHAILPIPNKGDSRWGEAWIPVVAPIAGAIVGAFLFKVLFA